MMVMHVNNGSRKRGATVAATVVDGWLRFGVSVCSPADQYNRKLGRTIACGRAEKRPQCTIPLCGRDPREVFSAHAMELAKGIIGTGGKRG